MSLQKKNFGIIPLWLLDELTKASEIRLFIKMYSGWQLMKDEDNLYFRSIGKLKEDIGVKKDNVVSEAIRHFEKLGIIRVVRSKVDGKSENDTNKFEFIESALFNDNDEVLTKRLERTNQMVRRGTNQTVRVYNINKKNICINTPVEETLSEETQTPLTNNEILESEEMKTYNISGEEAKELREYYSKEWKELEETRQSEHINSQFQKVNEWVGKKLSRGYDLLKSFEDSKTLVGAKSYSDDLFQLIEEMKKARETNSLTEKQDKAFEEFVNAYNKAVQNKNTYFNRGKQMKAQKQSQTVRNGESAQDYNLTNEEIEKAYSSNEIKEIEKKAAPTPTPRKDTKDDYNKWYTKVQNIIYSFTEVSEAIDEYEIWAVKEYGDMMHWNEVATKRYNDAKYNIKRILEKRAEKAA